MSQYYVTIDGKECGPLDDETIRFNLQTRRITLKTPCRTEGDDWCVVGDYFVEDTYVTETASTIIQPQAASSKMVVRNKPTFAKEYLSVFLVSASAILGIYLAVYRGSRLASSDDHSSFPTGVFFNHLTIPFMFAAIPAYWSKRHGRNWRFPFAFWGVSLVIQNLIFLHTQPSVIEGDKVLAQYWIARDGGIMLVVGILFLLIEWVKRGDKSGSKKTP